MPVDVLRECRKPCATTFFPYCLALGASGADGLTACLEMLRTEIITTMGLVGVKNLSELNPKYVTETKSVRPPHEHSAFPLMPEGRLV